MKKIFIVLLITTILYSCELLENKESKAIKICQQSKAFVNTDNPWANLFLGATGLNSESTWLDWANVLAQNEPNLKYDWKAKKTDLADVYIISFADEKGWGHRWEVTLNEQIVKHINASEFLSRKYGISRISGSNEFSISETKKDTLKLQNQYLNSESTIIYEFRGKAINNTNKNIIKANIEGKLKLIFEEKVVEEGSRFSDGFITSVSKSNPWKPGEEREFKLLTSEMEEIYADYAPPYAFFEIQLKAEDPVGYNFDENIAEIDIVEKWIMLKQEQKINKEPLAENL